MLPRLLFSLEVLPITKSQLYQLTKFHVDNLKRFQPLPTRTATCAVYLLLGALPVEAELHKRQLSLLYNILVSTNETIVEFNKRQIAINLDNELSFYCRVHDILNLYNLPPLAELQTDIPSKNCKASSKRILDGETPRRSKSEINTGFSKI